MHSFLLYLVENLRWEYYEKKSKSNVKKKIIITIIVNGIRISRARNQNLKGSKV